MISSSASYAYTLYSHKINNTTCDLQDDIQDGHVVWKFRIFLRNAVPFLFFMFIGARGDASQGGAMHSARKVMTILLVALSTVQLWKAGFVEEVIMPEGNWWMFSGLLVLVYGVYKFSRSKKWARSASLLTFWLVLLVSSCVSIHDIIRLEGYRKNVNGLLLPLAILGLVLGHLLLSIFRNTGTKALIPEFGITQDKSPKHPEDEASFLSRLFLDWVFSIVWAGYQKKLKEEDIPNVNIQDKCDTIYPAFEHAWKEEELKCQHKSTYARFKLKNGPKVESFSGKSDDHGHVYKEKLMNQKASLLYALIRAYGPKYFFFQFLNCALKLSDFIYPLMIESLMKYVQNRNSEPKWRGYGLIIASCLVAFLTDTMHPRLWVALRRLTSQMKMVITMAVYKKALTLSNDSRKEKTAGQLVSLISEDLDKISHAMEEIYLVVLTPVQTLIAVYLLYHQLGMVALLALAVLLCLIPINSWLGRKLESLEEKKNEVKDDRVKVMNEVLNGIKVLKLYAWENSFIRKICGIRDEEMAINKKIGLCYSGLDMIFRSILFLVRFMGLVSVVILGEHLDSPKAFLTLTLFMLLSYPFSEVAVVIPACVQAGVSLTRVNNFLTDKDIDDDVVTVNNDADAAIAIRDGTFTWDPTSQPTLKTINLVIPQGGLVAVVGVVGSGKSSLLSAMLGEMEKLEGKVTVKSSIAYVPQEAWIQNATLRNNVLFGSEFQAVKYDQVIRACALRDDFKILAAGDQTEIGEKGINLSGGQKQRVSLARAVYSDADIYLFDDPLSAVDAHVGKHIFNKVIGLRGMLKNKTRVLVTHGVHWLPFVDNIIVMKDGAISECGTYKQLLGHNGAFAQFLKEVFLHEKEENDSEVEQIKRNIFTRLISLDENEHPAEIVLLDENDNSTIDTKSTSNESIDISDEESSDNSKDAKEEEKNYEAKGKIIDEEDTEFGSVSLAVYKEYLMAVGPYWVLLFSAMFTVMMASRDFNALWVGRWTEDPLLANVSLANTTEYRSTLWMYVSIYALCGITETVTAFLFSTAINKRSLSAATQLHTKLLTNILRYPMAFFDTTPTGRIINRFSKDVDSLDRLGEGLDGYIQCAGEVLTNLVMVVYITPTLIPFIILVSGVYIFLQSLYVPSARQLRRYRSKFSSPVFVHFKETLDGTQTLRAFKAQDRFVNKMKNTIEERLKFDLMQLSVRVWFGMKISTLSQFVSLAAGLIVMWDESISPSHAGLLLSFSAWFVQSLGWYVQHASYTEQELVSLERVIEYSNKSQEAAWELPEKTPVREWPQNGDIFLEDYQARYRDGLDLVLRGVTCRIYRGEKVGIVGRTGAGKSSLTVALFRLVEAASGQIIVDDHQIASLGLHDLRKKITILPQDPVIFGGSLRMNLDPFHEKSSEELWEALKHSHLQTFVENLPGKLDYECGEAGKNLSVGQRQLVCLARTLLRKTKILVLDEATAAVDMETDDLIQKTICNEFKDSTVLTIAHRLNTVMEYDRILVMEQGLVKEFDSPKKLLANTESAFYGMAKDANLI